MDMMMTVMLSQYTKRIKQRMRYPFCRAGEMHGGRVFLIKKEK